MDGEEFITTEPCSHDTFFVHSFIKKKVVVKLPIQKGQAEAIRYFSKLGHSATVVEYSSVQGSAAMDLQRYLETM